MRVLENVLSHNVIDAEEQELVHVPVLDAPYLREVAGGGLRGVVMVFSRRPDFQFTDADTVEGME